MEKIYVLLRHDQQTGPYSLAELTQFDLKPYDLIWMEGRSAGWYYPQEIAALHPYLSFLPQKPKPPAPTENKIVPQQPGAVQSAAPAVFEEAPPAAWQTIKPAITNLEAAVHAQFEAPAAIPQASSTAATTPVQNRKSPHPAVVSAVTVLIVGGVFAASWLLNRGGETNDPPADLASTSSTPGELLPAAVAADENTDKKTVAFPAASKKRTNGRVLNQVPATQTPPPAKNKQSEAAADPTIEKASEPLSSEDVTHAEDAAAAPAETPSPPQEKKKSLRDKIADLFRKKPAENKAEERRPAETENGERVATRRDGAANLAQLVYVRFDVPNDWMMGIRGARATLVNRSSQKIAGATVAVSYYNDENELLQKKTISFGKIDAKESKTIAIPDHPTATKVDYEVVSVVGQPAA